MPTCAGASCGHRTTPEADAHRRSAVRVAPHHRQGHPRQAAPCPGAAESPGRLWRCRRGARPRARRAAPRAAAEARAQANACAAVETRAAAKRSVEANASAASKARAKEPTAIEGAEDRDVVPWLRRLGFRADEA